MKESWNYTYQLSKRFDWIISTVLLMFITDIIIIVAIFLADVNNFFNNLIANSFLFKVIFGVYLLAGILVIVTNRGELHYHYEIRNGELIITKNKLIDFSFNHELEVNRRIGNHIILNNVTKIELLEGRNEIKIKGMLILTSVYVNSDELMDVYNTLLKSCPNIRNK